MNYAATFVGLLVLVLCEQIWLRVWRGRRIDWLNMVANLNSGHMVLWLLRGVEVTAYAKVLEHFSLNWIASWPLAAQWTFGMVAWDLAFYTMHRTHHSVPLLWKVHRLHHEGREMSLSLAIRNSWFSSLSDFPFMLPLAIIGLPLHIFLSVSAFHYAVQFFNHSDRDIVGRLGWLDRYFVTPSNHRSHHGLQEIYHNRNFGSTFLCWDRLFGTYQPELDELPRLYGLAGSTPRNNPVTMHLPGLVPWFDKMRRAPAFPGCVGAGGILLFCLVAYAVDRGGGHGYGTLVGGIALGSIALGAAADGARAGFETWAALAIGLVVWVFVYDTTTLAFALSMAVLAQSLGTIALLLRQ